MTPLKIGLWKIFAVLSFFAWFTLLTVGITINSGTYLANLSSKTGGTFYDFLMVMLAYTPTNVALMAVLAGLIGGLTSNLAAETYFRLVGQDKISPESSDFQRLVYMSESPIVAAMRGFMVYMIFLVGANLSLTSENGQYTKDIFNLATKTANAVDGGVAPTLYYKFSLTVSLLSFLVGFDPSKLGSWVDNVSIFGGKVLPKPAN